MHYTQNDVYAFWWTETRLVVAAAALFIGGTPPVYWFFSLVGLEGLPLVSTGLTFAWIISGAVAAYLLWRWHRNKMMLFGVKKQLDRVAFLIAQVSGLNLGLVGLIGTNIGMSITSSYAMFIVVGLAYLWSAYHLHTEWKSFGGKFW